MGLIADILLAAGAIGAAVYCFILAQRLKRFNDLEKGVGGAVAVLSSRVDDLTKTLSSAQKTAAHSAETLQNLTEKAEEGSRRIELQMASIHDFPLPGDQALEKQMPPEQKQYRQNAGEPMFVRHRNAKEFE